VLECFIWKWVDPIHVLDSLAAYAHLVRIPIESRLHGFKDGFVLPA
jgi:hypothetical protein